MHYTKYLTYYYYLLLHAKYMTVQSNDKSMNKYYYSMVYGLYFIVIMNRAFYVAVFNVL